MNVTGPSNSMSVFLLGRWHDPSGSTTQILAAAAPGKGGAADPIGAEETGGGAEAGGGRAGLGGGAAEIGGGGAGSVGGAALDADPTGAIDWKPRLHAGAGLAILGVPHSPQNGSVPSAPQFAHVSVLGVEPAAGLVEAPTSGLLDVGAPMVVRNLDPVVTIGSTDCASPS